MSVECFVLALSPDGNRWGDAHNLACVCIHLAPIPKPYACARIVEGVAKKPPMMLLGYRVRGMEYTLDQTFTGCCEFHVGFEFYPAFADAPEVRYQAFMKTFQIVWAYDFCLGKARYFGFWLGLRLWLWLAKGWFARGFGRFLLWGWLVIVEQHEGGCDGNEDGEIETKFGDAGSLGLPAVGALLGTVANDVAAAFAFLAGHGVPSSCESDFRGKVTSNRSCGLPAAGAVYEILESWEVRNGGSPA